VRGSLPPVPKGKLRLFLSASTRAFSKPESRYSSHHPPAYHTSSTHTACCPYLVRIVHNRLVVVVVVVVAVLVCCCSIIPPLPHTYSPTTCRRWLLASWRISRRIFRSNAVTENARTCAGNPTSHEVCIVHRVANREVCVSDLSLCSLLQWIRKTVGSGSEFSVYFLALDTQYRLREVGVEVLRC
jgi:hypothetical protein